MNPIFIMGNPRFGSPALASCLKRLIFMKFPKALFENHCNSWNNLMKTWYGLDKNYFKIQRLNYE